MSNISFHVLSLSLSGTLLMLLLFLLCSVVKNYLSKTWQYYIWLLILFRFLVPVGFSNDITGSLIHWLGSESTKMAFITAPKAPTLSEQTSGSEPKADSSYQINSVPQTSGNLSDRSKILIGSRVSEKIINSPFVWGKDGIVSYLWVVWLFGVLISACIKIVNYRSFIRYTTLNLSPIDDEYVLKIFDDILMDSHIRRRVQLYKSHLITTPMVIGFFRPRILLPAAPLSKEQLPYILKHEVYHLKRHDLIYKWLLQSVCCLHWFNPFLRLASSEINKLCELSCDEAIIRNLDKEDRFHYGDTLLDTAELGIGYKDSVLSATLVEHRKYLKERLTNIMKFHKHSYAATALSLLLVVLLSSASIAFGTGKYTGDQKSAALENKVQTFKSAEPVESVKPEEVIKPADSATTYGEFDVSLFSDEKGKTQYANKVYDSDSLIAGTDICLNFISNKYTQSKGKMSASAMRMSGSRTILIVNAKTNTKINLSLSYNVKKGKFKLVYISPDKKVSPVPEPDSSDIIQIPIAAGRNVFKIVGKDNCQVTTLKINFSGLNKFSIKNYFNSETDEQIDSLQIAIKNGEEIPITIIEKLICFMDEDTIHLYMESIITQKKKIDFDDIIELCPFISSRELGRYVESTFGTENEPTVKQLEEMAPYMDSSVLSKAMESIMERQEIGFSYITSLAPFLKSKTIALYLTDYCNVKNKEIGEFLSDIAPFAPSDALSFCMQKAAENGTLSIEDISSLSPFATSSGIGQSILEIPSYSQEDIDEIASLLYSGFINSRDGEKILEKAKNQSKKVDIRELSVLER